MVLSAGTMHHGHIMSGEICNDDQNYLSCITLIFFFFSTVILVWKYAMRLNHRIHFNSVCAQCMTC